MPRRDSNSRHADYDSEAFWLYTAFAGAGGQKRGHTRGAGADARRDEALWPAHQVWMLP
jgi:hypothetical protein